MTDQDKRRITDLRNAGRSYQAIADETGISLGSVKMFFKRSKEAPMIPRCEQCHKELRQDINRFGRRFCCDKCRVKWWTAHPDQMKEKAEHCFKCKSCGKEFYSRKPGKYCSRACFYASRRGGVTP